MAGRSQCRQCESRLPAGANYCPVCGTRDADTVLDPIGIEVVPMPTDVDAAPRSQLGLVAGLAVLVGMVVILWGLSTVLDRPDDEATSSEAPDGEFVAAEPAPSTPATTNSTPDPTTEAPTTTRSTTSEPTITTEPPGPVLGDGVDGVVVNIFAKTMERLDLATGDVEQRQLEHVVNWEGPQSGIVVGDKHVAVSATVVTITDLTDGTQLLVPDNFDGLPHTLVAGPAGADAFWVATYPSPDMTAVLAFEVDLDGDLRRRVEIPQPFAVRWAEDDELILEGMDGAFRYDVTTGTASRIPGAVIAVGEGYLITTSCEDSLRCTLNLDRGSGPEVLAGLDAIQLRNGAVDIAPDLSGALVHVYGEQGIDHSYVDLATGVTVDLGRLRIEPFFGVLWIDGSPWIVAQEPDSLAPSFLAINTETGEHVDLDLTRGRNFGSFLAFLPAP